ncbi:MAG TPA: hypothetical protein VIE65_13400 [Methylobacter sp.]|jgi:hypothetical protein
MIDEGTKGLRSQVAREVSHWEGAAERLDDFEGTASPSAWQGLERYLGVTLRNELKEAREQLKRNAAVLRAEYNAARTRAELVRVALSVSVFKGRYLQTELLVDFYVDAVRARTNPELAMQLRAFDVMAERALSSTLAPLGKQAPPILVYLKPGIGASILRINTPLWDGSLSQVAAIKLTYHNRVRPTALLHETGHQFSALTGWNETLARAFRDNLKSFGTGVAEQVAEWTTEIAADFFAFAHAGFAALAALADVVSGRNAQVFRYLVGDPHPIAYLRVFLGVEMCRRFYGMGPWDDLAAAWEELHPLSAADAEVASIIRAIMPALPRIVEIGLLMRMPCFNGKALVALVDPQRVSPGALREMQHNAGGALYVSSHFIWMECLRLTALSGLRYAIEPQAGREILRQQEDWMVRLGQMSQQQGGASQNGIAA